jgi:hypothetical protein
MTNPRASKIAKWLQLKNSRSLLDTLQFFHTLCGRQKVSPDQARIWKLFDISLRLQIKIAPDALSQLLPLRATNLLPSRSFANFVIKFFAVQDGGDW